MKQQARDSLLYAGGKDEGRSTAVDIAAKPLHCIWFNRLIRSCAALLQVRIVKEDGAIGLFRGAGPTVVRAMALNMGMLASNDEVCFHRLSVSCMG